MAAVLVNPDTVATLCAWLKSALAAKGRPVPVVKSVPNPRPKQFVTLQRHGGIRPTLVTDAPQIGVECWAESAEDAHDLAMVAHGLLLALPGTVVGGHTVNRVEEWAGPSDLPDPLSAQPRFVFELQVHVRLSL